MVYIDLAAMENQIWATLNNLKFKGFYLSLLLERYQKWDRNLNIFLAITSSGSIAGWVVWDEYPLVWATLIAVSQVITVVKPYFPFFKYVKELNSKCFRVENLNIEMERLWYKMRKNKLSEDEIETEYFDIKKQMVEIFNFSDETVFGSSKKIENKANEKMKIFLKNEYNEEIQIK